MTSQGQRFRRRALRRGYKVDEVDAFLERVEATVAGEPIDAPVTAQEVRDVMFRTRFGGYDEWQVDLHLDRVERQLAEVAGLGPALDPHGGSGPPPGLPSGPPPGPPVSPPGAAPLPHRPVPAAGPPSEPAFTSYDQTYAGEPTYGGYDQDRFHSDMTTEMRMGDPGGPPPERQGPPPPMGGPGYGPPPHGAGYEQPGGHAPSYEQPGHGQGGYEQPSQPAPGYGPPAGPQGHPGPPHGHGAGAPGHPSGPPQPVGPPMSPAAPPMAPASPMPPNAAPPMSPSAMPGAAAPPEAQRVDQLRRGFQPRRFGSGYDRGQVDQLFEQVLAGLSGRGPMSVSEAQLDPRQFDLVSGGYFEGEVEQALQEVREILRRR